MNLSHRVPFMLPSGFTSSAGFVADFLKEFPVKASLRIAAMIIFIFFLTSPAAASVSPNLIDVRHSSSHGYTRLVFDLSKPARFKHYLSDDRQSLFIELLNCDNRENKDSISLKGSLVKQVNIKSKEAPRGLLIQVSLNQPADYKLFTLNPGLSRSYRLVVDFSGSEKKRQEEKSKPASIVKKEEKKIAVTAKKKVLVIDPGHGGEDPGAVSCNGTKEKDIVLRIARDLKDYLEQKAPHIQVYLTRDGDYFIPLHNRIKIARKYGADLFISLHTNASKKKEVQGASVYYISETGASDKASDLLAARENSSDLIAGVKLSEDKLVNTILIDLVQTYTINESIQVCNATLKGLLSSGFQNQGIRCANFAVLKSPSFPSALLEIGYITNRQDEEKLLSKKGQQQIVQQLGESVMTYLANGEEEKPILSQSSGASHGKTKAIADTQL